MTAGSQDLLRGRAMTPWKARGRPSKDSFCLNGLGALKYPYGEPIPRIYLGAVESIPQSRGAAFQAADTLSSGSSRPESPNAPSPPTSSSDRAASTGRAAQRSEISRSFSIHCGSGSCVLSGKESSNPQSTPVFLTLLLA